MKFYKFTKLYIISNLRQLFRLSSDAILEHYCMIESLKLNVRVWHRVVSFSPIKKEGNLHEDNKSHKIGRAILFSWVYTHLIGCFFANEACNF